MTDIKILAIDDSKDILFSIQAICELEGWEVISADSPKVGIDIFRTKRPDLVIVDYFMPQLNGIETVKKLREIDKNIPIIALTISDDKETVDKFFAAGANDFSIKPIKALDFISRIRTHLVYNSKTKSHNDNEYIKGISKNTADLILKYMKDFNNGLKITDISKNTGLAYQTVHRYLQYFITVNKVRVEYIYGSHGRPTQVYYLT